MISLSQLWLNVKEKVEGRVNAEIPIVEQDIQAAEHKLLGELAARVEALEADFKKLIGQTSVTPPVANPTPAAAKPGV